MEKIKIIIGRNKIMVEFSFARMDGNDLCVYSAWRAFEEHNCFGGFSSVIHLNIQKAWKFW